MALEDRQNPGSNDLFKSAYGLVFFGVPNLGLRHGKLREITAGQLNEHLISDLEVDTETEPKAYLEALRNKFVACCRTQKPPFEIVSYYEEKMTPTLKVSLFISSPLLLMARTTLLMV